MDKKILNKIKTAIFTPTFSFRNVILSLVVGIFLGYISLVLAYGPSKAATILSTLFKADFNNQQEGGASFLINKIVVIGLAGLAVMIGMKSKILNIGVSGQMTFGAIIGTLILNKMSTNNAETFIIGLIFSILGATALAGFMGALKTYLKVNEVVAAIMLNWAVVFFGRYFENSGGATPTIRQKNFLFDMSNSSSLIMYSIIGLAMFILIAVSLWFFFQKTTTGFKVIRSGEQTEAAKYAGYNAKVNKMFIFLLSGAIAGIAGFVYYYISNNGILVDPSKGPTQYGFTGIAVALVGMNSAIGILFSGFLFGIMDGPFSGFILTGGLKIQVITIFSGVITYFVSIITLWQFFRPINILKDWNRKLKERNEKTKIKTRKGVN